MHLQVAERPKKLASPHFSYNVGRVTKVSNCVGLVL